MIKQCEYCGQVYEHHHLCKGKLVSDDDLSDNGHTIWKCQCGYSYFTKFAYDAHTSHCSWFKAKHGGKGPIMNKVWQKAKQQTEAVHSSTESQILSTPNVEAPPADALEASALILKQYISALPAKDQGFAMDMLKMHGNPKQSPKQQYWLKVMADKAKKIAVENKTYVAPDGVEEDFEPIDDEGPGSSIGGFEKVYALFQSAAGNGKLKNPKIHLQLGNGSELMLYLAGKKSKKPNVINMTDGKPYGQNKWYGRIYPDGKWERPKSYKSIELVSPEVVKEVVVDKDAIHTMLMKLAQDPVTVAKDYGKLTGKCCFCKKKLTDDHSLGAGFGAVCAEKYGLSGDWKKAISPLLKELAQNPASEVFKDLMAAKKLAAAMQDKEDNRISAPKVSKNADFLF